MRHSVRVRPSRLLWIPLLTCFLLPVGEAQAAPYRGEARFFPQPDGGRVEVRLFGTEFYMRGESPDGYALTLDSGNGFLCYAALGEDGGLRSTGIRYRGVADADTLKLLARRGVAKGVRASSGWQPRHGRGVGYGGRRRHDP